MSESKAIQWGSRYPMAVGGEVAWVDALAWASTHSYPPALRIGIEQGSGTYVCTDNAGKIPTRAEFRRIVDEVERLYELFASDDRVEKANADIEVHAAFDRPVEGEWSDRPGIVYIIEADHGFQKIGKTENLESRFRQLATASPFELRILLTFRVADASRFEALLHEKYAAYRTRAEWFKLPTDALKQLHELKDRLDPD